ncbi:wd-repeat protein interacting with phosphoinosides wipi -related [Anaeramoeba flamelloides]|uniref:Wd-repeat protein interacting with phosphoinosides wipi -related n=1 Tax=Anaeramoeba flamelloides TaxID=1746091 RepID=A0ABQ8YT52_9EUKA|nr:wd-repeat protein interacting with phosphoinosides wipi -related [Anaeramoeba flamelloides]
MNFFSVGNENGWSVYAIDPLQEKFSRRQPIENVSIVELMDCTNIVALVGGKDESTRCNLYLWDDKKKETILQLKFPSEIYSVKIACELLFVLLERSVLVYKLPEFQQLEIFNTSLNSNGILEMKVTQNEIERVCTLATFGPTGGTVRIKKYSFLFSSAKKKTLQTTKKLKREHEIIINTCELQINKIALSSNGTYLATCSDRGTIIKIWSTITGKLLCEKKRGNKKALIFSLSFSPDCSLLAASSFNGTLHVFKLPLIQRLNKQKSSNKKILNLNLGSTDKNMKNEKEKENENENEKEKEKEKENEKGNEKIRNKNLIDNQNEIQNDLNLSKKKPQRADYKGRIQKHLKSLCGFNEKNEIIVILNDATFYKFTLPNSNTKSKTLYLRARVKFLLPSQNFDLDNDDF